MNYSKTITATSLATIFALSSANAAVLTQTVNSDDWNDPMWENGVPSTGNAAPTAGNDYITSLGVGGVVRTNQNAFGTDSTFAGDNLTLASGTRMLMKNQDSQSTITGNLTMQGAVIDHGPNAGGGPWAATLNATTLIVSGNNEFAIAASTGIAINATLTGTGNLYFANRDSSALSNVISISDISSFTGTITVGDNPNAYASLVADFGLTLSFGSSAYQFQDTLTLLNSSILRVNDGQTLTFNEGDLIDGITPIGQGTYNSASGLGSSFSFLGSGSIVVIPEPSTAFLGAFGLLALLRRRRN